MATNDQGVTVQRQYIGARYVPKFFQGPDGSPAWVGNIPYEAMTIVTYLGNSYTSKIPVPQGIGNPSQNPTYWALTGAYNAQVGEYQRQVQEYKQLADNTATALTTETTNRETADTALQQTITDSIQNITNIYTGNNKKMIVESDSYGMRTTSKPTWTELTVSNFPGTINISVSSIGFLPWEDGTNFQTVLAQNTATLTQTEKDSITDIIVCGGWNDARQLTQGKTITQLQQQIFAYSEYCREQFKNATVHIGFIGWQTNDAVQKETTLSDLITTQSIYENSVALNLHHLLHASQPMKDSFNFDTTQFHPNPNGSTALYFSIIGDVFGGVKYKNRRILTSEDFTIEPTLSATLSKGMVSVVGNIASITAIFVNVSCNNQALLTFNKNVLPYGYNTAIPFVAASNTKTNGIYCSLGNNRKLSVYDTLNNGSLIFNIKIDNLNEI